jgi:hypothetical protein
MEAVHLRRAIPFSPASEGTYWIHGHHVTDSPEVRALIVAWALVRWTGENEHHGARHTARRRGR